MRVRATVILMRRYRQWFSQWGNCTDSPEANEWAACSDLWLTESNELCKTQVYRYSADADFFNYTTGFQLPMEAGTAYYEYQIPIIEQQLVKAGVRMAHVLNQMYDGLSPQTWCADTDGQRSQKLSTVMIVVIVGSVLLLISISVIAAVFIWRRKRAGGTDSSGKSEELLPDSEHGPTPFARLE